MDILDLIINNGNTFAIIACFGMAWYVKYVTDQDRKERIETALMHKEESEKMAEAVNNNSVVLEKFISKMDEVMEDENE